MAENDLAKELEQMRKDMAALRADVAELGKALKNAGAHKAESVKDSLGEEIRKGREALREKLNEAQARGHDLKDGLEDRVENHPYTSLLTALGVGFVLAKLMHFGDRH
jgi:ElaB/YqjD/DUF883 family membrane-anchored ribosome-binding protein